MRLNQRKKMTTIFLASIMVTLLSTPLIHAENITLDGTVSETAWVEWFEDSTYPSFNAYYYFDEDYVYLGIVLDIDNANDPNLKFAFRADASDFLIKITKEGDLSFYPGDSSRPSWWGPKRFGLPNGVELAIGETDGSPSYEVRILKEILGDYTDVPDGFPLWIMSVASDPAISHYYPVARDDWWFYRGGGQGVLEIIENDDPPSFHVPEYPLGSILSLVTMMAALGIISKRVPKL